ncbi:hypothetical protein PVK06_034212 [Gossypium arboreum]|uniref:Uncharacterized protein n=1 Tax=Gossypium arboreum TaxID=29729 RepID=A0ABR0NDJ0_GOSAR|nr:hypothetical protein PVK06_034212 [Gossypium arboreum]
MRISLIASHRTKQENEELRRKIQFDHSNLQGNVAPLQEEIVKAHAKSWQDEMDALRRYVQALHPDVQDMD